MADRNEAIATILRLAEISENEQRWIKEFLENPHLASDILVHMGIIGQLLETQTALLGRMMGQVVDIDDKLLRIQEKLHSEEG